MMRWLTWQRVPVDRMRIDNPVEETRVLLGFAIFYVVLAAGVGWLIAHHPLPLWGAVQFTDDVWYVAIFKLGALLMLPTLWLSRRGYRVRDLLPGWRPAPRALLVAAAAFALGFTVNLGRLAAIEGAWGSMSMGELLPRLALGVLLPLLAAALPEELVYRALLQTRLEKTAGRPVALVLTAALFAAWHLPTRFLLAHGVEGQAGDMTSVLLGTGVPVFLVGLVFGLLWDRHRSLVPLIAAHWGLDLLPSLSSLLGVRF